MIWELVAAAIVVIMIILLLLLMMIKIIFLFTDIHCFPINENATYTQNKDFMSPSYLVSCNETPYLTSDCFLDPRTGLAERRLCAPHWHSTQETSREPRRAPDEGKPPGTWFQCLDAGKAHVTIADMI